MTDISVWYKSLPFFTKYWLTLTVGISLIARFGLISNFWLFLDSEFVFRKFQVSDFANPRPPRLIEQKIRVLFTDMETGDVCVFLSHKPSHGIPFYVELLLSVQLFVEAGK